MHAVRDGHVLSDPRVGPLAKDGWDWVAGVYDGSSSVSPKEASATGRPASALTANVHRFDHAALGLGRPQR